MTVRKGLKRDDNEGYTSRDGRFYIYKDYILKNTYRWGVGESHTHNLDGQNNHLESFDYLKDARAFVLKQEEEPT